MIALAWFLACVQDPADPRLSFRVTVHEEDMEGGTSLADSTRRFSAWRDGLCWSDETCEVYASSVTVEWWAE